MIELPAGLILCLMAIVIAIMVAAVLPIWVYTHPGKLEERLTAQKRLDRAEHDQEERVLVTTAPGEPGGAGER